MTQNYQISSKISSGSINRERTAWNKQITDKTKSFMNNQPPVMFSMWKLQFCCHPLEKLVECCVLKYFANKKNRGNFLRLHMKYGVLFFFQWWWFQCFLPKSRVCLCVEQWTSVTLLVSFCSRCRRHRFWCYFCCFHWTKCFGCWHWCGITQHTAKQKPHRLNVLLSVSVEPCTVWMGSTTFTSSKWRMRVCGNSVRGRFKQTWNILACTFYIYFDSVRNTTRPCRSHLSFAGIFSSIVHFKSFGWMIFLSDRNHHNTSKYSSSERTFRG